MKACVLFDRTGRIVAMMYVSGEPEKVTACREQPGFGFVAEPGKRVALLDIPAEFRKLNSRQLQAATKVDLSQETLRLIAAPAQAHRRTG
jgi:hypothetical protein